MAEPQVESDLLDNLIRKGLVTAGVHGRLADEALTAVRDSILAGVMDEQLPEFAYVLDREPCDMCGHESHTDSDCGEVTGYDHLNGDHECGCPGSLREQLAQAWDEGKAAEKRDWEFAFDLSTPDEDRQPWTNPYRVYPPVTTAGGDSNG